MPVRLSRGRQEIAELLHIAPIRRGPVLRDGEPLSISYADRLQLILEAFNRREDEGFPSVIRVFRGIHSAQWALLDGNTRLLLSVVFDGGFEDYLRALARDVPGLLGLIWSNCEGWRPVKNDPGQLIQFIQRFQTKVSFLYAHHPALTVPDIDVMIDADVPGLASTEKRLDYALRAYEQNAGPDTLFESYRRFQKLIGALYSQDELRLASEEAYGGREKSLRARLAGPEHEPKINALDSVTP